jgi:hypothetical protein
VGEKAWQYGTHPRSNLQARTRREKGIHRPIEEAASGWRGRSSVEEKVSSDLENKNRKGRWAGGRKENHEGEVEQKVLTVQLASDCRRKLQFAPPAREALEGQGARDRDSERDVCTDERPWSVGLRSCRVLSPPQQNHSNSQNYSLHHKSCFFE